MTGHGTLITTTDGQGNERTSGAPTHGNTVVYARKRVMYAQVQNVGGLENVFADAPENLDAPSGGKITDDQAANLKRFAFMVVVVVLAVWAYRKFM